MEAEVARLRARSQKLQFPTLLEEVNAALTEPMAFAAEFASLQKARNCLEHRGGRVGAKDMDANTSKLALNFPRLKMFYMRKGEEVEVQPGEVIDTHETDDFAAGYTVQILMQRVTRSREYPSNDPVVVSASDFYEIAMACYLFAADVASKLPTKPSGETPPEAKPA